MPLRIALLGLHAVLLVLAATSFTVVTYFGGEQFRWEAFKYFSQRGWGKPYEFPYSLPVVVTYLLAYAIGVAAYYLILRSGARLIGLPGFVLCAIGFLSFGYELTHWMSDHYGTLIVSFPVVLLPMAVINVVQQFRLYASPREPRLS